MIRSLRRLFTGALFMGPTPPESLALPSPTVTLYARVPASLGAAAKHSKTLTVPVTLTPSPADQPTNNHRQRVLSMKLGHTRICSAQRSDRLATMGIFTAGDMAFADPTALAKNFKASRRAERVLVQYRRAIRLAATVPGMTPRDAMLLVSIHRRSAGGLARETPAVLYRDLERFAESSQGQSLLRGRRLPSSRRIKQWVTQCDSLRSRKPMHAQAA